MIGAKGSCIESQSLSLSVPSLFPPRRLAPSMAAALLRLETRRQPRPAAEAGGDVVGPAGFVNRLYCVILSRAVPYSFSLVKNTPHQVWAPDIHRERELSFSWL